MKLALCLTFALSLATSPLAAASTPERREDGNLVYDGIPKASEPLKQRLEQYENTRAASLQAWLPEGILISTRFGESNQLHLIKGPLQYRQQLTFAAEPINNASHRPKSSELLYLKDSGGNEFTQIFRFDLKSGISTLLSDGKSKNTGIEWQKSGKAFAFSSTRRNNQDTDIFMMQPEQKSEQATLLLQEGGSWAAMDWDHKGERLIVQKDVSANENFLFILDVATKKLSPILPGGGFAFNDAKWSSDGKSIFLVNDRDGEFQSLYRYTIADQKLEALSAKIPWNIESLTLSEDGKTLAFVSNENGIDRINLYNVANKSVNQVEKIPMGVIGKMTFSEKDSSQLAFSLSHAQGPSDVFTYSLKSKKIEKWTESEVGGLNRENFVAPTAISFPSFDQMDGKARSIPAFYYKTRKTGKAPVVILIHGGPESQFQPGFNATIQYFVTELGASVLAPNVRGSTGYGKTYLQLDNGFKREDSVKDIGALLDWIKTQKELDADKVIVMGGSYGGYMVLASLVHYSDRLAAGIDNVGISHFISFLTNTQAYRRDLRRVEYGDERNEDMKKHLEAISPLTNVSKIKKPLLVAQGLNDPRVPASEAEQIVKAVRGQGLESWYLLAKDEGHGFQKKKNQAAYLETVMMFAEKIFSSNPAKVGSENRP
jgi:dipeptidyl aminopeptidase/acylaminoacyl peptidase